MGHWGWGRVKAGKRGSRVIGEVKAEEGEELEAGGKGIGLEVGERGGLRVRKGDGLWLGKRRKN